MVVNDFLMANFPDIMDYNFTAKVESQFDQIAEGKEEWKDMMNGFDKKFEPAVKEVMEKHEEHKVGERELGVDPKDGKPVIVKIGRFGPVVQIGKASDIEKPRFAQVPKDKSIETITLQEALDLFKLPRTVGDYEGKPVEIGSGKFGPYVKYDGKYVSLPKDQDPMSITLEESVKLILQKEEQEAKRHLKSFGQDPKMEVMNGRYGPYIAYDGKNYRIPKNLQAHAAELTYDQCKEIVENAPEPKQRKRTRS
jgi:DNA topoisomerase-1